MYVDTLLLLLEHDEQESERKKLVRTHHTYFTVREIFWNSTQGVTLFFRNLCLKEY